jgi:hypothetical protein
MGCDMVLSYVCVCGMNLLSNLGMNYKVVREHDVAIYWLFKHVVIIPQIFLNQPPLFTSICLSIPYTIYTMSQAPIGTLCPIKQGGKQLTHSPSIRLRQDWPTPFCQGT